METLSQHRATESVADTQTHCSCSSFPKYRLSPAAGPKPLQAVFTPHHRNREIQSSIAASLDNTNTTEYDTAVETVQTRLCQGCGEGGTSKINAKAAATAIMRG